MTRAVARETVAASNLANVDTPNYRSQEIEFQDTLARELGATLALTTTSASHQSASLATTGSVREAPGLPMRRDGNTVQLDRELLTMSKAAGEFSAAQTALSAKFRLVRYAINEGR